MLFFLQDYPHEYIDIVIADGGSKDDTIQILEEYHSRNDIPFPFIRISCEPQKLVKQLERDKIKVKLFACWIQIILFRMQTGLHE